AEKYESSCDQVAFVIFNKEKYDKWRGTKVDSDDLRSDWLKEIIAKEDKASEKLRFFNQANHICEICGKNFTGYKNAKVCSNACRLKKSRLKKKENLN
ncbi:hypothetical protein IO432_001811, partial [Campylobacter fetus]|nr:hypothetical protein [Campylobacter fetus]